MTNFLADWFGLCALIIQRTMLVCFWVFFFVFFFFEALGMRHLVLCFSLACF